MIQSHPPIDLLRDFGTFLPHVVLNCSFNAKIVLLLVKIMLIAVLLSNKFEFLFTNDL